MNDKELMNAINKIQTELNNIKKALTTEAAPTFSRVANGTKYYSVIIINEGCVTTSRVETGHGSNSMRFTNNNYFYTRERVQEAADKINMLLLLERLHDTYCPDYKPNWADDSDKYFPQFDRVTNRWITGNCYRIDAAFVYFPTEEIAQKACDILNA